MASDSEVAFDLQVEEALTTSLLDDVVSSPNITDLIYDAVFDPALPNTLQRDNLYKYKIEILNQYKTEVEVKCLRLNFRRHVHDCAFTCEISTLPKTELRKKGDNLIRPYVEGSSSNVQNLGYRVYVKGLVEGIVGGICVAMLDWKYDMVFELSKSLSGMENKLNGEMVELKALIAGLDAILMMDLKGVTIVTDNPFLHQYKRLQHQNIRFWNSKM